MKKILIVLLFPCFVNAQLLSVDDIATYSNPTITVLNVTDSIRGGNFVLYTGSDAADNGMIFADANNNKWKRQAEGQYIKVTWYGAHQTATAATNQAAFAAAANYIFNHWVQFVTLYVPGGNGYYQLNNTLFYTRPLSVIGDGYWDKPTSRLNFPWNTSGIVFHEVDYDYRCEVRNLEIKNQFSIAPIDSNVAGIKSRAKILIDNNHIAEVSGFGILLEACAGGDSTNNPIFGNVDFAKVTNNKLRFNLTGLKLTGCDANYVKVYDNDFMQNKRWGVDDNGFLGNLFFNNSFGANGNAAIAGTATTVHYNGQDYSATTLHDDGSGVGKRPDQHPSYWRAVIDQASTLWDTAKHYWSGGSRISRHPSGTSQWYNNYEEGDQASPVQNTRSTTLFGVRGAGLPVGGVSLFTNQGTFTVVGKTDIIGNFGIGVADVANIIHPLTLESTVNGTLADFKTTGTSAIINLKSANNSNAYFWSQGGNLYYGVNGVQMQLNANVFKDYGGNGVIDLGSAGNRFKDVHAVKYYGDGSSLTGIAGGGITQQALDDTAAAIRAAIPNVTGVTRVWLPDNVINANASANTLADVTGLTFPVVAGTRYSFKVVVVYNSAATTTGSRWTVNGPAVTDLSYRSQYNTTATGITTNTLGAYNLPSASNASSLTTNSRCVIEGEILPSANGDVQVRFASEISNSAITAIGGRSYLEYQIIN